MKSHPHTVWIEWGFRCLLLILLGIWLLLPAAGVPAPLVSVAQQGDIQQGGMQEKGTQDE